MLEIKLYEYGLENALENIGEYLKAATKSNTKKQKNEMVYKALGAVYALMDVILVEESDEGRNPDTEG